MITTILIVQTRVTQLWSQRCPKIYCGGKGKTWWHYANHGDNLSVEVDWLVHYADLSAKAVLPEGVANDSDTGCSRFVICLAEETASDRLHAQGAKYPRRHKGALQPKRIAFTG